MTFLNPTCILVEKLQFQEKPDSANAHMSHRWDWNLDVSGLAIKLLSTFSLTKSSLGGLQAIWWWVGTEVEVGVEWSTS